MTVNKLTDFCNEVEAFINASPPVEVHSITEADAYLRQLRSYKATILNYVGQAEILYNSSCIQVIINCEPQIWNRIKNSSTQTNRYCVATCSSEYNVLKRIEGLNVALKDASSHFITLISFRKEEMIRMGVSNVKHK